MKQTSRRSAVFTAAVLMAVTLAGCSGNSSSTSEYISPALPQFVNGYVGESSFHNALVYAVPITGGQLTGNDEGGFAGFSSRSSNQGFYQVRLLPESINSPVVLVATNADAEGSVMQRCEVPTGCGETWAFGKTRDFTDDEEFLMQAAVGVVRNQMRININWLTHLATSLAFASFGAESKACNNPADSDQENACLDDREMFVARAGFYSAYTIEKGNLWVARLFNDVLTSGADLIALQPLAPSQLVKLSDSSNTLTTEGIVLGALLAAMQQRAVVAGKPVAEWVLGGRSSDGARIPGLVDELLENQGRLYERSDVSFTSLFTLYDTAQGILESVRPGFGSTAPASLEQAISRFNIAKSKMQYGELKTVVVNDAEVASLQSWTQIITDSDVFVTDLYERLLNFKGEQDGTCTSWSAAPQVGCTNSFIDPAYIAASNAYYEQFKDLYDNNGAELRRALRDIREGVLEFTQCLNTETPCSEYFTDLGLRLTVVPLIESASEDGGAFTIFDFRFSGKQTIDDIDDIDGIDGIEINWADGEAINDKGETVSVPSRLLVEYGQAFARPPLTGAEKADTDGNGTNSLIPVGAEQAIAYDLFSPNVTLNLNGNAINMRVGLSLAGVRDAFASPGTTGDLYRYNLAQFELELNATGPQIGDSTQTRNQAELSLKYSGAAATGFYPDKVWPDGDKSAWFTPRTDVDSLLPKKILYSYEPDYPIVKTSDAGLMAEIFEYQIPYSNYIRYENYRDAGKRYLRICSLPDVWTSGSADTLEKECGTPSLQANSYSLLNDLILKNKESLLEFEVPARGFYRAIIPDTDTDTEFMNGNELTATLVKPFVPGVGDFRFDLTQELFSTKGDRLPAAKVKMQLSRPEKNKISLLFSLGYDFDAFVPFGDGFIANGQSLFLSYNSDEITADDNSVSILSSGALRVIRGGYQLRTGVNDVGAELLGDGRYTQDDSGASCGLLDRDRSMAKNDTCEFKITLSFRGALIGIIREELPDVYVVRYSDGRYTRLDNGDTPLKLPLL